MGTHTLIEYTEVKEPIGLENPGITGKTFSPGPVTRGNGDGPGNEFRGRRSYGNSLPVRPGRASPG